jgi:DNA-binding GntR family transcriptional regulator
MSEPTLKLRVYEGIKQFILSGKLRPGQKLAERDLGKTLKVSRRPIREALGRLVQDGLVENRPQRGHFVREVDAKTVEDLYDLREMLEKHAIRLAMRRFSDADLAELDRVGRQLRRFEDDSVQGEEELREGQRIDEILARASRNDLLFEMLMRLYDRLQMFVWIDTFYADEAPLTHREHQAIIRAARGRDEKRLLKLVEAHLRHSKNNVLRVLQARPTLAF